MLGRGSHGGLDASDVFDRPGSCELLPRRGFALMLGRILHRSRPEERARPRLREDDVIRLARREVGEKIPIHVVGCSSRPEGIEWRVETSTLNEGATLCIDDASGVVTHKQRWERRKLFSRR